MWLNSSNTCFPGSGKGPESVGFFFPIPYLAFQHSEHLGRAADHCAFGKSCEKSVYAKQVCKHLPMQCTIRLSCPIVQERCVHCFNIINYYLIFIIMKEALGDYTWAHNARTFSFAFPNSTGCIKIKQMSSILQVRSSEKQ